MRGSLTRARAMAMRWRCPPDSDAAELGEHRVVALRQLQDEFVRAGQGAACTTRSSGSGRVRPGRCSRAPTGLNSTLSCSTTPMRTAQPRRLDQCEGRHRRPAPARSPARNSRWISFASVLLPEPERPTTPTTSPGADLDRYVVEHQRPLRPIAEARAVQAHRAPQRRQAGAAGVLAGLGRPVPGMSPRRRTDRPACWNSCQTCARRRIAR